MGLDVSLIAPIISIIGDVSHVLIDNMSKGKVSATYNYTSI